MWPPPPSYSSSSVVLHLCVDLGLTHDFVTLNFSGLESFAASPTSNPEDHKIHFFWPLPFDLSGMAGPTRSLLFHQHKNPGHRNARTSRRQSSSPRRWYVTSMQNVCNGDTKLFFEFWSCYLRQRNQISIWSYLLYWDSSVFYLLIRYYK